MSLFFQQRGDTVTLLAPYDRLSGEGALIGSVFGVAVNDVLSGVSGEWDLEGLGTLKKSTGFACAVGTKLYWDNSAKAVTTTSSANTLIGSCMATAASADTTIKIRLNGTV